MNCTCLHDVNAPDCRIDACEGHALACPRGGDRPHRIHHPDKETPTHMSPEELAAAIIALCERENIDLPTLTAAIQILCASALRALA